MENLNLNEKNTIYNFINNYGHQKAFEEFQIKVFRRHLAAYRIQQEWYKVKYNPYHPIGKKFIIKNYDKCFTNVNQ